MNAFFKLRLLLFAIVSTLFSSQRSYGQTDSGFKQKQLKNNRSEIYECAEVQPSFPGGIESLKNFVKRNLRHPSGLICCEGAIYVSFIVNEDGTLSDHKVIRGGCGDYDKYAIEVFKNMPKWNHGKQNDRAVKVRCVYPVKFTTS